MPIFGGQILDFARQVSDLATNFLGLNQKIKVAKFDLHLLHTLKISWENINKSVSEDNFTKIETEIWAILFIYGSIMALVSTSHILIYI